MVKYGRNLKNNNRGHTMLSSSFIKQKFTNEWSRWPKQGWQYGGDSSHWTIAGRSDERSVGFSYECNSKSYQRFNPRINAEKIDDHISDEKKDQLTFTNFDFDQLIPLLHLNKLISDTTLRNYQTLGYQDFVKSVKDEKYVSFAGVSKEGTWLFINNERLKVLDVLEKENIIPPGITKEYKKFSEEAQPIWEYSIMWPRENKDPINTGHVDNNLAICKSISKKLSKIPIITFKPKGGRYESFGEEQRVESIGDVEKEKESEKQDKVKLSSKFGKFS